MSLEPVSLPVGGLVTRKVDEITRLLMTLHSTGQTIHSVVGKNLMFASYLLYVDPDHRYIELAPSDDQVANDALVARPRANFVAESGGWHIEFAAADPRMTELGDEPTITLDFPVAVVSQDRRCVEPRVPVSPQAILRCLADEQGVAPFDARIIDISNRGVGFLLYHSDITLEPGTVLKGCRIQRRHAAPVSVDLEVRYSTSLSLPDGRIAHRSGCVFLNPNLEVGELIASFNPA